MEPSPSPDQAVWNALHEALIQAEKRAGAINRGPGGREIALVITKIQEALHWTAAADTVVVTSSLG